MEFLLLRPTFFNVELSDKALIINPNNALFSEEDLVGNAGKELIGKNDCKSCHNTYVKTIGPSYTSVAEKYQNTEDNINYLVGKVIKGGSGVWGNVLMTAHPELPNEDARTMVEYIMSLDKDTEVAAGETAKTAIPESDYFKIEVDSSRGFARIREYRRSGFCRTRSKFWNSFRWVYRSQRRRRGKF
jgi:cytochrome c551/c552